MRTYILTASAFAALANAQTFTLCNPMEKDCDNNPAIAKEFESNFKDGEGALQGWQQTAKGTEFTADGAVFSVKEKGDAPTIQSDGYLHFGYVEVTMKAAHGAGIVSSIVLESDDLDEVDWEFIGSETNKAQMNYFGKGNTTVYDRMIKADVPNVEEVHKYALNWTAEALTWIIDDKPVRTLKYEEANGGHNFPQTPCNVRIGIWAGGDSKDQGTRDWAGGNVDYSQAPFKQTVEKVKIINYTPGKEYEWTDKSGSWESIKVIDGEGIAAGNSGEKPKDDGKPKEQDKPEGEEKPKDEGKPEGDKPAETSCSEESAVSTPPPEATTPPTEDDDCDCDVVTVTVTGPPPESTPAPPPETPSSEVPPPPETTETPPPETTTSEVPPPPETTDSPPPETPSSEAPPSPPVTDSPPPPETTDDCDDETTEVPPPPQTTESPPPPPAPPVENPGTENCTTHMSSLPPYPTGGIIVETSPMPSVPYPTDPTGALPNNPPNSTAPIEYIGAGSRATNALSYVVAAAAGVLIFAL